MMCHVTLRPLQSSGSTASIFVRPTSSEENSSGSGSCNEFGVQYARGGLPVPIAVQVDAKLASDRRHRLCRSLRHNRRARRQVRSAPVSQSVDRQWGGPARCARPSHQRMDRRRAGESGRSMSQAVAARPPFITGIGIRQIRLGCGLILFTYLLSHFANHALGNISYAAMEEGLAYHMQFWRNPLVAAVFYSAAIVHWMLGLWALYQRRQFRYRGPEITQLLLGLSIPFLIVVHLVYARVISALFDRDVYYAGILYGFWVRRPYMHWVQFVLLLVAWTHGCIGLYFWLRLKGFFRRSAPWLLAAAVLIPTLALLGVVQGAREVVALSANPAWRADTIGPPLPTAQRETLDDIIAWSAGGYLAVLALILAARGVRTLSERRGGLIKLSYPGGRVVEVPRGWSVLEASLRHRIPHASVCGGRARCSTCRIRVVGDLAALPSPSPRESFVLARVGASADPAIRLACQLRPETDIAFFPIFRPQVSASSLPAVTRVHAGEERYGVSMF